MKKLLSLIFAAMIALSMSMSVVSYAMPTDDKKPADSSTSKDKKKKKKSSTEAPKEEKK